MSHPKAHEWRPVGLSPSLLKNVNQSGGIVLMTRRIDAFVFDEQHETVRTVGREDADRRGDHLCRRRLLGGIAIELVDGRWEKLPEVAAPVAAKKLLVAHALKRKIDVTELRRDR